jgi:hypothetical protein
MSARLMRSPTVPRWPGSVKTGGGLHVHHLVFGIVLLLGTGFASGAAAAQPLARDPCRGLRHRGRADARRVRLWLHLEDVYWIEEGRRSVDAVVIAALLGGLLLMGFLPFSTDDGALPIVLTVLVVVAIATVAVLKGKIVMGVAGVLLPAVGLIGAVRLAKPASFWATPL